MSAPLNTRDFAAACGVVPETIREWVRLEHLAPAWRTPGGHLRFTVEQVEEIKQRGRPSERAADVEAHVLAARARLRMRRGRAG